MPRSVREAYRAKAARANVVKQEKMERRVRAKSAPDAYRWKRAPDNQTLKAFALANAGQLPPPTDISRLPSGEIEYIWAYQGQHGLATIDSILLNAKQHLPTDAAGYIAQGSGFGKQSEWAGSTFAYVHPRTKGEKTLWWESQTFQSSTTTSIKHIREKFKYGLPQWSELKLITKEGVKNATTLQADTEKAERGSNKPTATKRGVSYGRKPDGTKYYNTRDSLGRFVKRGRKATAKQPKRKSRSKKATR